MRVCLYTCDMNWRCASCDEVGVVESKSITSQMVRSLLLGKSRWP